MRAERSFSPWGPKVTSFLWSALAGSVPVVVVHVVVGDDAGLIAALVVLIAIASRSARVGVTVGADRIVVRNQWRTVSIDPRRVARVWVRGIVPGFDLQQLCIGTDDRSVAIWASTSGNGCEALLHSLELALPRSVRVPDPERFRSNLTLLRLWRESRRDVATGAVTPASARGRMLRHLAPGALVIVILVPIVGLPLGAILASLCLAVFAVALATVGRPTEPG